MKQNGAVQQCGTARQPAAADSPLTRGQVAGHLGTSIASVRRMEGKTLHPTKGADGVNLFDPIEVAALAAAQTTSSPAKLRRSADGDLAAETFMRFSKGLTPREVVIELRQPPDVVQALHRQWREAGGLWLPRTFMATIRKSIAASYPEVRDIRIDTPEDLVGAVHRLLSDIDDARERLWERADEIAELQRDKRALREKLAQRRAELADWADWAARQEAAATAPSKADG